MSSVSEAKGALFLLRNAEHRFLLQQRDEHCKYFPLQWCFPGEHKKEGEEVADAASRGASEEYHLTIPAEQFAFVTLHKQPHTEGSVAVMLATLPEGQEPELREGKAMAWKTLAEIESTHLGFGQSNFLPILKQYLADHV